MQVQFDHEKLRVYKQAIEFVVWCNGLLEKIPKSMQFMMPSFNFNSSLIGIVSMLMGLIGTFLDRVGEDFGEYGTKNLMEDHDHD